MSTDPIEWLIAQLINFDGILQGAGIANFDEVASDVRAVRGVASEIAECVVSGLDWARQPWPSAVHDERGLAHLS